MTTPINAGTASVALTGDPRSLDEIIERSKKRIAGLADNLNEKFKGASGGVGALRESLRTLVVQATGVNPQLGRIAEVLSSLAVGGGVVTAATGGIIALAAAWRHFTGAAREAAQAQEDAVGRAVEAARIRALGGPTRAAMGAAIVQRPDLERRLALAQELAGDVTQDEASRALAMREVRSLTQQLEDLETAILEWGRQLGEARGAPASARGGAAGTGSAAARGAPFVPGAIPSSFIPGLFRPAFGGLGLAAGAGGPSPLAIGRDGAAAVPALFSGAARFLGPGATAAAAGGPAAAAVEAAASRFGNASQIAIASFGAMAEAAIGGSQNVATAVTGMFQAIIANIQTKSGGLFGATPLGALVGAGVGIVGALFGRGSRDPVRVDLNRVSPEAARTLADAQRERPIIVKNVVVASDARSAEDTERVLRNRQARDAVPDYTGRG